MLIYLQLYIIISIIIYNEYYNNYKQCLYFIIIISESL